MFLVGPSNLKARRSERLAKLTKKSYVKDDYFDLENCLLEVEGVEGAEEAESEDVDMVNT